LPDDARIRPRLVVGDLIPDRSLRARAEDEFHHSEIVERVADLLTTAEPPLNVGLFGPWGSGKSSFGALLQEELAKRDKKTAFVTYNAWKYSGEALQRSFLLDTAESLDVADHTTTSTLRHEVERSQLDLKHVDRRQLAAVAKWALYLIVPFVAIALFVSVAAVSLLSWAANKSASRELLRFIPTYVVGPAFIAALLATFVKLLLDASTVKLREAPPTEEGFEERFKSLLKLARDKGHFKRFVFFVDELDRVSSEQVVTALQVIKNFLDQPDTVFVVAADEEVIERALRRSLPQATPANEDEPYYSSASEFLDKIFQHQIDLPPLRGQRLTRFARDLVVNRRAGLWETLQVDDAHRRRLNGVLYALIPSHVRSPRRVKVLLNNYATNARIAESRQLDWLSRSQEIAKLTVLQTEFPLFAADLHLEPRLPSLVLAPPSSTLSPRASRLVERHRLELPEPPATEDPPESQEGSASDELAPTDSLLLPRREQLPLISTQRENLRRYLQRTTNVPDPGRDLLFLEAGGAAEGLDDPALGELIEAEAVENPDRVVAVVKDRPEAERQRVVSVLAGIADQEFGEERANVINALFGVATTLDWDLGPALGGAGSAVTTYAGEEGLAESELIGALRLGFALAAAGDTTLRDEVLGDDRLLANADRTRRVANQLDQIQDAEIVERVHERIANFFPEDGSVLSDPLMTLAPPAAAALLNDERVRSAAANFLSQTPYEESREIVAGLIGSIIERRAEAPLASLYLVWILATSSQLQPDLYVDVRRLAITVPDLEGTSQIRNSIALLALGHAPRDDWDLWQRWLDPKADEYESQRGWSSAALIHILTAPDDRPASPNLIRRIRRVGRVTDDDVGSELTQAIQTALGTAWWPDEAGLERQLAVHAAVRAMEKIGPSAADAIATARHYDLSNALNSGGTTPVVLRGIAELVEGLSATQLADLAARLRAVPLTGQKVDAELVGAQVSIQTVAKALGEETAEEPYSIPLDRLLAAARPQGKSSARAIAGWFEWNPSYKSVITFIEGIGRGTRDGELDSARGWFRGLSNGARRSALVGLAHLQTDSANKWINTFVGASRAYDEQLVVRDVVSEVMGAGKGGNRHELIEALIAVEPSSPQAQREVGELIIWLLERNTRVDLDNATLAVGALGKNHRMGKKVAAAFRASVDANGWKVPSNREQLFLDAKVSLPKGAFEKTKKRRFRLPGR
jgi:hypothetical protein